MPVPECDQDTLVHSPPHYKLTDDLEVQDIINAMGWTRHHRLASALEYILRAERKGNFEQDIRKAITCLEMLLEVTE